MHNAHITIDNITHLCYIFYTVCKGGLKMGELKTTAAQRKAVREYEKNNYRLILNTYE